MTTSKAFLTSIFILVVLFNSCYASAFWEKMLKVKIPGFGKDPYKCYNYHLTLSGETCESLIQQYKINFYWLKRKNKDINCDQLLQKGINICIE